MARARTHVANAAKLPDAVGSLIENQLDDHPELRPLYELMTDEQSRVHEGEVHALEHGHFRQSIRYFHAWRIDQLRQRLGDALATVSMLDVGDTDGLMLKHLGKPGLGFNLSPVAIENIRSNGIEAELGDGERMPFDDGAFDVVLCFETLEHVPNPEQLLEELGMTKRADALPSSLSGGERQRVSICRALINNPDLLLVDEPTASLDSKRGHQVVELIARESRDRGKIGIMVTHDLEMTDVADGVFEMHDGGLRARE